MLVFVVFDEAFESALVHAINVMQIKTQRQTLHNKATWALGKSINDVLLLKNKITKYRLFTADQLSDIKHLMEV